MIVILPLSSVIQQDINPNKVVIFTLKISEYQKFWFGTYFVLQILREECVFQKYYLVNKGKKRKRSYVIYKLSMIEWNVGLIIRSRCTIRKLVLYIWYWWRHVALHISLILAMSPERRRQHFVVFADCNRYRLQHFLKISFFICRMENSIRICVS